ncbi:hypothetical protein ACIQUM_07675 [Amycolatopsis azurea]|uniref:hypothetical protein n=1 Tax=Amycolatopsis azurea TaxID=36819 RepID=UPI00381DFAAD
MDEIAVPRIPMSLMHRPTVGGLVVPYVTLQTENGRFLLGHTSHERMRRAVAKRWCGVCQRPLGHRGVLMMRLSDLPHRCTVEPALHPWCAKYTGEACPMIHGRLDSYRSSPARLDDNMLESADAELRRGDSAEPWFAVWITSYDVIIYHGTLAASYAKSGARRIRPVTWRLPGVF